LLLFFHSFDTDANGNGNGNASISEHSINAICETVGSSLLPFLSFDDSSFSLSGSSFWSNDLIDGGNDNASGVGIGASASANVNGECSVIDFLLLFQSSDDNNTNFVAIDTASGAFLGNLSTDTTFLDNTSIESDDDTDDKDLYDGGNNNVPSLTVCYSITTMMISLVSIRKIELMFVVTVIE